MGEKKFYTHKEIVEEFIGEKGTPKRDKYEEDLEMFLIGEAIKQARQAKNLTQEELGKMVGVQKAQISRIENGKNLTFSTVRKLFKAMGLTVSLEVESLGKVSLC
jgi:ribosome-binding protein aMBF1 (putative translation factor)